LPYSYKPFFKVYMLLEIFGDRATEGVIIIIIIIIIIIAVVILGCPKQE